VGSTATDYTGLAVPTTGRQVAVNPNGGFYTLASDGTVTPHDGAPYFGSPRFPGGLARSLVVVRNGMGYLVLDGLGGVHKFGSAARGSLGRQVTPYFGFDIARDITLTPDGRGYAVLDGYGGVHVGGTAQSFQLGYWPGWDIVRAFAYAPDGGGAYLLGSARRRSSSPALRQPSCSSRRCVRCAARSWARPDASSTRTAAYGEPEPHLGW